MDKVSVYWNIIWIMDFVVFWYLWDWNTHEIHENWSPLKSNDSLVYRYLEMKCRHELRSTISPPPVLWPPQFLGTNWTAVWQSLNHSNPHSYKTVLSPYINMSLFFVQINQVVSKSTLLFRLNTFLQNTNLTPEFSSTQNLQLWQHWNRVMIILQNRFFEKWAFNIN